MITVGAVSLGWSGTPLRRVFEELAAMGGACVEINGNADQHHGIILEAENLPRIRAWAEASGLAIRSLSGYCDFAQTDTDLLDAEVGRLMATCRAAAELDVPVVRAFVGTVKPGIPVATLHPMIVGAFQQACREAAALGVTLGIENHGHLYNDGPTLVALIEEVGADNLGVTLDTGNFAWAGHDAEQVRADFAAVLPHVVNVHIKDGVWDDGAFRFVPAGEGDLPLTWLLAELVARGYAGPVYSEFEGAGDFRAGTAQSIAYLKVALEKARA